MRRALCLILGALALPAGATAGTEDMLLQFPSAIDPACRAGRAQLYDECGSQFDVLRQASEAAQASGKVVLVVYGAEWCIWCHVFSAYVAGGYGTFDYRVEDDAVTMIEGFTADREGAADLSDYTAETFVIAHIEQHHSPDGDAVLSALDAWGAYADWIPYIFTIRDGRFAAALPDNKNIEGLEVRRDGVFWYRGYQRATLLKALQTLEQAAR